MPLLRFLSNDFTESTLIKTTDIYQNNSPLKNGMCNYIVSKIDSTLSHVVYRCLSGGGGDRQAGSDQRIYEVNIVLFKVRTISNSSPQASISVTRLVSLRVNFRTARVIYGSFPTRRCEMILHCNASLARFTHFAMIHEIVH